MDDDAPRVRQMPGPVRPQWGELDAVLQVVLSRGGDLSDLLQAAQETATEEDLDPRRAADRARAAWHEHGSDDD